MTLNLRRPRPSTEFQPSIQFGGAASDTQPETESRNVLVTSGIHSGRFPISGLQIRGARSVLAPLVNIDDNAVAVINGRVVEEDEIIAENVTMVAFVKPSAIKGAI